MLHATCKFSPTMTNIRANVIQFCGVPNFSKETHAYSLTGVHLIWRYLLDSPNYQIKATAKYTTYMVYLRVLTTSHFLLLLLYVYAHSYMTMHLLHSYVYMLCVYMHVFIIVCALCMSVCLCVWISKLKLNVRSFHNSCTPYSYACNRWLVGCAYTTSANTYVTGYWKTNQNVTLGQLHFIGPAKSHTHTLPVHCCINGLS